MTIDPNAPDPAVDPIGAHVYQSTMAIRWAHAEDEFTRTGKVTTDEEWIAKGQ